MAADHRGQLREQAAAAEAFAADRLGPASARFLSEPSQRALLVSRLRGGASMEDAALAVLFGGVAQHRELADEFLAHFLGALGAAGHRAMGPGLRRFLDTGDLVQSVLGDLWPDWTELHFDSREQFLALLRQRLQWKAQDRAKGLQAARRREDRRVALSPEETGGTGQDPSPATLAGEQEEWERLALVLCRLPERDAELLRMHLAGKEAREIAEALDLGLEAARKGLQRALARARSLAASSKG